MSESTPAHVEGKVCIKCGELKPHSEYGSRGSGRVRNDCKRCVADYNRARYQGSPEVRAKHKALRDRWRDENPTYHAEYYQDNRDKACAYAAEYSKRKPVDPERKRRRDRTWYAATRDERRSVDAAWRAANPEAVREMARRGQSRRRARLRGLPAEPYTMAQLIERDGTDCVLCGDPLDLDAVHPEPWAPTVEHLECISWGLGRSAGDVPSNCAVAHFRCNCQRSDRPHPAAARKRAELLAAEAQPA